MSAIPGTVPPLLGAPLRDRDGEVVGLVEDLLVHVATSRPAWLVVRLGGGGRAVVPARAVRHGLAGPHVSCAALTVLACPAAEPCAEAARHFGVRTPVDGLAGIAASEPSLAAA